MTNRQGRRDAKNLAVIGASAAAGLALTAALFLPRGHRAHEHAVVVEARAHVPAAHAHYDVVTPLHGTNRLFGRVTTDQGDELVGYLRWDRNEGSWADLLDSNKLDERGRPTQSGIRFGHIERIEPVGDAGARFLLKSGEVVDMGARASDLGSGLRALRIDGLDGNVASLEWHDIDAIEFLPTPLASPPHDGRLYGTLTVRSGERFTGFVTWDVDEIYGSDVLDGDEHGQRLAIPFGAIETIGWYGSSAAHVVLHDGREMTLRGTNDVNASNSGISVSDANLGQVKVGWDVFREIRFHGAEIEGGYDDFDGGRLIEGTVVTEDGDELSGRVIWDRDEARSWEMLNGRNEGVEYHVEFGKIERIVKEHAGVRVHLFDGRTFRLHGSNDVDSDNRGIIVEAGNDRFEVSWEDFKELRLDR
jgi:hypothetical protein